MADGARPQTSVPLPAGLIAGLGDASAAIKMARKEIKELQRDITAAVRKGEQVSPDLARRLDQAQKLEASLVAGIQRQKQMQQGIQRTTADAQALKFLIGAQAFRQIFSGGMPDARALSAMVFASGEHIQKLATRAFGAGSKVTSLAKGFTRAAPFIGEAFGSVMDALDKVESEQKQTRKMVTDFQTGKYSPMEQDLYFKLQEENSRNIIGQNPNEVFNRIMQISDFISKADEKTMRRVVRPALEKEMENMQKDVYAPQWKWLLTGAPGAVWDVFTKKAALPRQMREIEDKLFGNTFNNRLADAIDTKSRELGYYQAGLEFTEEQKAYIKRQVISESVQKLSDKQRSDLLDLINKNKETRGEQYNPMFKQLAQIQREASDQFKETEIQKMQQIHFQNARRRVALNGRIGE
jgi:hypothetical protein